MTIDDDNSIYVGGIPYDATEESLRRTFDLYGSVVAVKIINDREVGGKCYCFVTFTNPRSAIDAIADMNGRTIGGRVVRVNEVRTRVGRPNFHRENFRRDTGRDIDWDRDKDRERDYVRDRYRDRNTERSRERDSESEKDYEHGRDSDRIRDHHAFDRGRDIEDDVQEPTQPARDHDQDWERGNDMDWDRAREIDKAKDHDGGKDKDREQKSRNKLGARVMDRRSRELSSNSSDDYHGQVKKQLELAVHMREELQKELILIQDKIEEKQQLVSDLQQKSQKLEDALADARNLSTQRELTLTKLHRCFLQTHEYTERLKRSEQELQLLVDAEMDKADAAEDANTRNGSAYANGQTASLLRNILS